MTEREPPQHDHRDKLAKLIRETDLNPVKFSINPEMVKVSREAAGRGDCLTTKELLEEINNSDSN